MLGKQCNRRGSFDSGSESQCPVSVWGNGGNQNSCFWLFCPDSCGKGCQVVIQRWQCAPPLRKKEARQWMTGIPFILRGCSRQKCPISQILLIAVPHSKVKHIFQISKN